MATSGREAVLKTDKPIGDGSGQAIVETHLAGYGGSLAVSIEASGLTDDLRAFLTGRRPPESMVSRDRGREVHRLVCRSGEVLYIKLYRMEGVKSWLRTLARVNKAQKSWRIGRTMRRKGLGTARPVGLLCKRKSFFRTTYVGITRELIDAVPITEALSRVQERGRKKKRLIAATAKYVARLHFYQIYHSDFTADNIMVREADHGRTFDINLIDLDAVRTTVRVSDRRRDKNLERMNRNFLDLRAVSTTDRALFLQHYLVHYPREKRSFRKLFRDILIITEQRLKDRRMSFTR